jgi:hypothetical protein
MEITIVFENFTASIVDFMVANIANIRLLAQFATIKSPIDAVKFSNTIQLSPISNHHAIVCVFCTKLGKDSVNLAFIPVCLLNLYILRHCNNIVYFSLDVVSLHLQIVLK